MLSLENVEYRRTDDVEDVVVNALGSNRVFADQLLAITFAEDNRETTFYSPKGRGGLRLDLEGGYIAFGDVELRVDPDDPDFVNDLFDLALAAEAAGVGAWGPVYEFV